MKVAQSCLTLCDPMDCSLPGYFIHGIIQARILEWVAFSRGSFQPRDRTQVSLFAGGLFTIWVSYIEVKQAGWQYIALTYSFPNSEPVHCSMPSSSCCFLTCIWASQEAGQVVWYSHLLKNFPQFAVILTVKGFSIVNEAESRCFSGILLPFLWSVDVGLVPLPFLNPAWTYESSRFTYCWSLAWRILSITLLVCEMSVIVS